MLKKSKAVFVTGIIKFANYLLSITEKILFSKEYNNATHICIYRVANIGDTITAIPAMYEIRQKFPNAHITLLTSPGKKGAAGARELLQYTDWVDEIKVYYDMDIESMEKVKDFVANCRKCYFDLFVQLPAENASFSTMIRNMTFAKLIGVKYASGFYISMVNLFVKAQNQYCRFPNDTERLLEGLPWKYTGKVEFPVMYLQEDVAFVDQLLMKTGIKNSDRVLAISFFGKGQAKLWSIDSFHYIAKAWLECGGKVIVIGGKEQYIEGNDIIKGLSRDKALNCCGEFSLLQSILLLKKMRVLLTVDTGTAHMASVTNTPCIIIFSSFYLKNKWVAYGDNIFVIRRDLQCSPCMSKTCKYGNPAKCMQAVSFDDVWQEIRKYAGEDIE